MSAVSNMQRISPVNIIVASVAATIVVTITMMLSGTDIIKALGGMALGMDAGTTEKYMAGGVVHLAVGLVYGILFTLFFAPVSEWNKLTKGVIFGFFITVMALVFMPLAASMVSGKWAGQAANPCAAAAANPCNPAMGRTANPCMKKGNPCATKAMNPCAAGNPCAGGRSMNMEMAQPCNPCGSQMKNPCMAGNPCNPCGGKASNPCNPCATKTMNPCAAGNPCAGASHAKSMKMVQPCNPCAGGAGNPCTAGNPCNPCGGGGGNAYGGLISLMNHIIFALVLAFMVRLRNPEAETVA